MASDNFTRSDENPLSDGGNWAGTTDSDDLRVVSNKCANASGTDTWSQMRRTDSTELSSMIVVDTTGGGNADAGPTVCMDGSGNGYAYLNSASFQHYLWELPSFGQLDNANLTNFVSGDEVRIAREGNDIVCYLDTGSGETEVMRAAGETTNMTGNPGQAIYHAAFRSSYWEDGATGGATIYNRSVFGSPIFGSRVVR
jgi:hypothetical protein